jgi:hypothetical protein
MKGLIFQLFLIILLSYSCSEDNSTGTGPDDQTAALTFTEINETVFQKSCAFTGCHASDTKQAGLDLSEGNAYANLVDVPSTENPSLKRVDPGNSANSYLVKKLKGEGTTRMPLNRAPLSDETITAIAAWIDDGAENN